VQLSRSEGAGWLAGCRVKVAIFALVLLWQLLPNQLWWKSHACHYDFPWVLHCGGHIKPPTLHGTALLHPQHQIHVSRSSSQSTISRYHHHTSLYQTTQPQRVIPRSHNRTVSLSQHSLTGSELMATQQQRPTKQQANRQHPETIPPRPRKNDRSDRNRRSSQRLRHYHSNHGGAPRGRAPKAAIHKERQ